MLNARIRKRWLKGGVLMGVIGEQADLTYNYNYLGAGPETLARWPRSRRRAETKPMFIVGAGAFARPDGVAVLASLAKAALAAGVVKDGWNGFNVLHSAASRVGGLDLGLVPGESGLDAPSMAKAGALDVLFNLGADEIDVEPGAFVVYIGTHGDRGAHRADVILPGAAYTEKTGIYVNTEGRPQFADRAVFPPGDAREDWSILRALSDPLGATAAVRLADAIARDARRRLSPSRALRRDRAGRPGRVRRRVGARRRGRRGAVRLAHSATSTSPTRSRAPRASWPNARPWRRAARAKRRNRPNR